MKSYKIPHIIYTDLESLIKKNRLMCKHSGKIFNNKKKGEHIPCGYSLSTTIWVFDNI